MKKTVVLVQEKLQEFANELLKTWEEEKGGEKHRYCLSLYALLPFLSSLPFSLPPFWIIWCINSFYYELCREH